MVITSWVECGVAMSGHAGAIPLSWSEIRAYSSGRLSEWECSMLKKMSEQYCSYLRLSTESRGMPPPWEPELTDEQARQRDRVIEGML